MGTTRELLIRRGMRDQWMSPKLCSLMTKEQWADKVYRAVEAAEACALRARFAKMSGGSAARYVRIKNWEEVAEEFAVLSGDAGRRGAHVIEQYLDDRSEPVGTRLKLMCRLGCLPTLRRVVREEKLPVECGVCRLCDGGEVEDTTHLLLACRAHTKHREKMLHGVEAAVASAGKPPLSGLPAEGQTDILLGQSTGLASSDKSINFNVTRFLKKAWRGRKWLTSSLNNTLGREDTVWALKAHGDGRRVFRALTPNCNTRTSQRN